MRILIHDYSGHPFQVQLSRSLAARGHRVRHVFCTSFQTPHANLARQADDPEGFDIRPVSLNEPFLKDAFLRRRRQEIAIGKLVAREIGAFAPDLVISSNAPLDTQRAILAATRSQGAKFIFWLQDIYSEAIRRILSRKMPGAGALVGMVYQRLEYALLRKSDHIVAIAEDFAPLLIRRGIPTGKITVIENWAPLDEIVPMARDNDWARDNMPHTGLRIVYSGTLGYKHNPQLLLEIARRADGHVYVFSEGRAAEGLKADAAAAGIGNLHVSGWVPYEKLPAMLSGADLFVAMIEKEAGVFSVPSKVLSYLCVGRPIIGFIPQTNLARRIITNANAGITGDPADIANLEPQLKALFADAGLRAELGRNARKHAERMFDIAAITDRFERLFGGL